MKSKIQYSFFLFLLIVSCNKTSDIKEDKTCADSLSYYKDAYKAANYFSIEANTNAQRSFAEVGVDAAMQKVQFDLNQLNKKGVNPLLPKTKENENIFMNKAAVLNDKWLILDYYKKDTDGILTEVGEVLIQYEFYKNKPCEFHVLSTNIYE